MKKYFIFILLFISNTIVAYNTDIDEQFETAQQIEKKQDSILYRQYKKADSLFKLKEHKASLNIALEIVNKANTIQDLRLKAKANSLIGEIWFKTESYKKSISYLRKSLNDLNIDKSYKKNTKPVLYDYLNVNYVLGKSYHNLFQHLAENDTLFSHIYRDSTLFYYNRIISFDFNNKRIDLLKSKVYNNLSGMYAQDKVFSLSESYAKKSLEIKRRIGDVYMVAIAHNTLSNINFFKEDYEKSISELRKGIEMIKSFKDEKAREIRADLYYNLAYSMYMLKDIKAYEYQEYAYLTYDSINQIDKIKDLTKITQEKNFELGKVLGIQQEEIQKQKAQRNTWILGIGSFFVIVVLAFVLNQYKLRQKNLRLALSQKETASQIDILNASLKGQEAERKRISQELHDGVLGKLFGSRMGLGYLELKTDAETQRQYQKFLEELQNIEKEIREVSHQLSNDVSTSETSFVNAVNQLLKEKRKLGKFESQLILDKNYDWKELDGIIEMNLFRILQECLQNILKHAEANNVVISFTIEKDNLLVEIKDDGIGFDTSKKKKGIGLKNIKSRVADLRGDVKISSEVNNGTSVCINIPMV